MAYDEQFFDSLENGAIASASIIVPYLVTLFHPRSVLDIGCGRGAWCSIWATHGVNQVLGVDNPSATHGHFLIPRTQFLPQDISKPFFLERKFDLVTSLEVAEHLPQTSSDIFVQNLTTHADVVVFSAAPPGQGGMEHLNEQPYGYWHAKFTQQGFACFDLIRPKFRSDAEIEPWYRYNTLVYCRRSVLESYPFLASVREVVRPPSDIAPLRWRLRRRMRQLYAKLPAPLRALRRALSRSLAH